MNTQTPENSAGGSRPNPWLTIPLEDYEGHMSHASVGQDKLLSGLFQDALVTYSPDSVCILGCSGGNGLELVPRHCRVCGIDINPSYVDAARSRFSGSFANASFIAADIEAGVVDAGCFDLVYAPLIFEYLDMDRALPHILQFAGAGGAIVVVAQLPTDRMGEISDTPFVSLHALRGFMRLVDIEELSSRFARQGYAEMSRSQVLSGPGKRFCVLHFGARPNQA